MRYFDIKGCNISSCEDSDKTARVQPNLIQLEYLWFCSYKIDVCSVMCVAKISVLAIYMLSYMEILTCFVWCLLILFYYVIKTEIKQLKRFFFCLYFNPVLSRNSFTTSVLQMYIVGNLVQQNSTCILYFGYVTSGYVELRITRSIFSIPLDFEITRLTCICNKTLLWNMMVLPFYFLILVVVTWYGVDSISFK